ncbi:putative RNA methyltransferase [Stackebrandtia soli]|uniref:putative RNA methyltransferase n=1 Tax=Stackebrandtia soli TaxID=1892856 RepID=UPI0039E92A78
MNQPADTALSRVTSALRCPVCREPLRHDGTALRCPTGHGYDIARQGYVSLLTGGSRANTGDTADQVERRQRFLARGHYDPIASTLSDAIGDVSGLCVDAAGGTGHYLATVLASHPGLLGLNLDLSTFAARRAARGHSRLASVRADVWQDLPILDGQAAVVLSVFGPRNAAEIARVLRESGRLVVVTPRADHLRELVEPLGMISVDPRKRERLDEQLRGFTTVSHTAVHHRAAFTHADIIDDVLMGPSAHHVDHDELARAVAALPEPLTVTVSVDVTGYVVQ